MTATSRYGASDNAPYRSSRTTPHAHLDFLHGYGKMGAAIQSFDWTKTPLGDIAAWPQSLRTALGIALGSAFPIFIWWGEELTNLYNDGYVKILGDKHPRALGMPADKLWQEVWGDVQPMVDKVMKSGEPIFVKNMRFDLNRFGFSEEAYFTFSYTPVRDGSDEIQGIMCMVIETTEEVLNERRAQESQAKLEAVFDAVADGIIVFDMEGNVVLMNKAQALVTGYRSVDLVDEDLRSFNDLFELFDENGDKLRLQEWPASRVLAGEMFTDWELRATRKDTGREWLYSFSGMPVFDDDRQQTLAVIVTKDITEKKRAEEELKESEARFRNLADTAPMYIAMANEKGEAVYFNRPWLTYTGMKLEDMLGLGWLQTVHPDDAPKFEADFKFAFENRIPINKQYRFRRADGDYRWMLAVGAPRFTDYGEFIGYYGTYTDFHDLKQAQLASMESEERFKELANNISQLAWSADKQGSITWYNSRWYEYTGTSFESMEGWGWQAVHHPDYVKRVTRKFKTHISKGQIWEDTFPLRGKDGKFRWFLSRAVPIKNDQGEIIRWFGTNTDIDDLRRTTKRKAELEAVAETLRRQQEELLELSKAKDEFISLASHQLRTPATGVKQYVGMLLEGFAGGLNPTQHEFLQHAYDSNERQLNIINDLLSVAQIDAGKIRLRRTPVNMITLLEDILKEQAGKFAEREQSVSFIHSSSQLIAIADKSRIRMALENLVDNASKYTPQGKHVTVSAGIQEEVCIISVSDAGVGIPKDKLSKIFEKFQRIDNPLSAIVGGSGLGLYLVQQIVGLHGGSIKVRSTIGKGSTFTMSLPTDRSQK